MNRGADAAVEGLDVEVYTIPTDQPEADGTMQAGDRARLPGRGVMSELPNPVNFDAASATVRPEDVARQFAVGPDAEIVDFFTKELADRLRGLQPAG